MMKSKGQQGDTLIEVMIAIAILSMAVVIAVTSMSYGLSLAFMTGERTAVRGELNAQLSVVRYSRDAYLNDTVLSGADSPGGKLWQDLVTRVEAASVDDGTMCDNTNDRPFSQSGMFYIDMDAALNATDATQFTSSVNDYPQSDGINPDRASGQAVPGGGVWLIARSDEPTQYIDFYAKACWSPLAGNNMQQMSTVLRMYTP